MRLIFILISLFLTLNANSFSKSKKNLLKEIYFDNKTTFYCSNPYEILKQNGKEQTLIIEDKNYYTPRKPFTKSGKENIRAKRVEWEHIMPAHNFGQHLPCWREGGRKACKKDKLFNEMESDMHNLVPAIGEVNGDRSNFKYGADKPQKGQYGNCQFQVDFKNKRAYVKDDIKGNIARVYFYMSEKYNIRLSNQEKKMFEAWNKIDPVDEWEKIKNNRVEKIQGNPNKFIK